MKYIIICVSALLLCFLVGGLTVRTFFKNRNIKNRKTKITAVTIIATVVFYALLMLVYLSVYYHADDQAQIAIAGNDNVNVTKIDNALYFDGCGDECAIIFYGGAKVESTSYAPLMLKLAESGFDCFLIKMPFNFALFGGNAADELVENYQYDSWLMAGHSMGGIVASSYAEKHTDKIDGIILLASYPTIPISQNLKLCSIYGSLDGCLDTDEYEKSKVNWPNESTEFVIEGGNHAQFANYGKQSGDNDALISSEKQQEETVKKIAEYFSK